MGGTPSTQTASLGTPRPAFRSLGLGHRLLDDEYGSFVGRAVQAVEDRTECFDDHFPCRRGGGL